MYKLAITDRQWWCYDIIGNIGWIAYALGLILCLAKNPEYMQNAGISVLVLFGGMLFAAVILVGLVELVSERIKGLSRVLPKVRLYRGFGAIALGSLGGAVVSAAALILALTAEPNVNMNILYLTLMCGGAVLCFVFVSLIFKGFARQDR